MKPPEHTRTFLKTNSSSHKSNAHAPAAAPAHSKGALDLSTPEPHSERPAVRTQEAVNALLARQTGAPVVDRSAEEAAAKMVKEVKRRMNLTLQRLTEDIATEDMYEEGMLQKMELIQRAFVGNLLQEHMESQLSHKQQIDEALSDLLTGTSAAGSLTDEMQAQLSERLNADQQLSNVISDFHSDFADSTQARLDHLRAAFRKEVAESRQRGRDEGERGRDEAIQTAEGEMLRVRHTAYLKNADLSHRLKQASQLTYILMNHLREADIGAAALWDEVRLLERENVYQMSGKVPLPPITLYNTVALEHVDLEQFRPPTPEEDPLLSATPAAKAAMMTVMGREEEAARILQEEENRLRKEAEEAAAAAAAAAAAEEEAAAADDKGEEQQSERASEEGLNAEDAACEVEKESSKASLEEEEEEKSMEAPLEESPAPAPAPEPAVEDEDTGPAEAEAARGAVEDARMVEELLRSSEENRLAAEQSLMFSRALEEKLWAAEEEIKNLRNERDRLIVERERALYDGERAASERKRAIAEREHAHAECEKARLRCEQVVAEREQAVREREQARADLQAALAKNAVLTRASNAKLLAAERSETPRGDSAAPSQQGDEEIAPTSGRSSPTGSQGQLEPPAASSLSPSGRSTPTGSQEQVEAPVSTSGRSTPMGPHVEVGLPVGIGHSNSGLSIGRNISMGSQGEMGPPVAIGRSTSGHSTSMGSHDHVDEPVDTESSGHSRTMESHGEAEAPIAIVHSTSGGSTAMGSQDHVEAPDDTQRFTSGRNTPGELRSRSSRHGDSPPVSEVGAVEEDSAVSPAAVPATATPREKTVLLEGDMGPSTSHPRRSASGSSLKKAPSRQNTLSFLDLPTSRRASTSSFRLGVVEPTQLVDLELAEADFFAQLYEEEGIDGDEVSALLEDESLRNDLPIQLIKILQERLLAAVKSDDAAERQVRKLQYKLEAVANRLETGDDASSRRASRKASRQKQVLSARGDHLAHIIHQLLAQKAALELQLSELKEQLPEVAEAHEDSTPQTIELVLRSLVLETELSCSVASLEDSLAHQTVACATLTAELYDVSERMEREGERANEFARAKEEADRAREAAERAAEEALAAKEVTLREKEAVMRARQKAESDKQRVLEENEVLESRLYAVEASTKALIVQLQDQLERSKEQAKRGEEGLGQLQSKLNEEQEARRAIAEAEAELRSKTMPRLQQLRDTAQGLRQRITENEAAVRIQKMAKASKEEKYSRLLKDFKAESLILRAALASADDSLHSSELAYSATVERAEMLKFAEEMGSRAHDAEMTASIAEILELENKFVDLLALYDALKHTLEETVAAAHAMELQAESDAEMLAAVREEVATVSTALCRAEEKCTDLESKLVHEVEARMSIEDEKTLEVSLHEEEVGQLRIELEELRAELEEAHNNTKTVYVDTPVYIERDNPVYIERSEEDRAGRGSDGGEEHVRLSTSVEVPPESQASSRSTLAPAEGKEHSSHFGLGKRAPRALRSADESQAGENAAAARELTLLHAIEEWHARSMAAEEALRGAEHAKVDALAAKEQAEQARHAAELAGQEAVEDLQQQLRELREELAHVTALRDSAEANNPSSRSSTASRDGARADEAGSDSRPLTLTRLTEVSELESAASDKDWKSRCTVAEEVMRDALRAQEEVEDLLRAAQRQAEVKQKEADGQRFELEDRLKQSERARADGEGVLKELEDSREQQEALIAKLSEQLQLEVTLREEAARSRAQEESEELTALIAALVDSSSELCSAYQFQEEDYPYSRQLHHVRDLCESYLEAGGQRLSSTQAVAMIALQVQMLTQVEQQQVESTVLRESIGDAERAVLLLESELEIVVEARRGVSERVTLQWMQLSNVAGERDSLQAKLLETDQKLSKSERTIDEAKSQIATLTLELADARKTLAKCVSDLREYEQEKDNLKLIRPMRSRIERLEEFTDTLQHAVRRRDEKLLRQKLLLEYFDGRLSQRDAQIESLQGELERTETKLGRACAQLKLHEDEYRGTRSLLKEREAEAESLKWRLQQLSKGFGPGTAKHRNGNMLPRTGSPGTGKGQHASELGPDNIIVRAEHFLPDSASSNKSTPATDSVVALKREIAELKQSAADRSSVERTEKTPSAQTLDSNFLGAHEDATSTGILIGKTPDQSVHGLSDAKARPKQLVSTHKNVKKSVPYMGQSRVATPKFNDSIRGAPAQRLEARLKLQRAARRYLSRSRDAKGKRLASITSAHKSKQPSDGHLSASTLRPISQSESVSIPATRSLQLDARQRTPQLIGRSNPRPTLSASVPVLPPLQNKPPQRPRAVGLGSSMLHAPRPITGAARPHTSDTNQFSK